MANVTLKEKKFTKRTIFKQGDLLRRKTNGSIILIGQPVAVTDDEPTTTEKNDNAQD